MFFLFYCCDEFQFFYHSKSGNDNIVHFFDQSTAYIPKCLLHNIFNQLIVCDSERFKSWIMKTWAEQIVKSNAWAHVLSIALVAIIIRSLHIVKIKAYSNIAYRYFIDINRMYSLYTWFADVKDTVGTYFNTRPVSNCVNLLLSSFA